MPARMRVDPDSGGGSMIALQTEKDNPWLMKVPPDTMTYGAYPVEVRSELGFEHLVDELRNAINPSSGLPRELMLKYSDLDKVTVPQAVERVAKINDWRAAQKVEADMARAMGPATQVVKEYPEQGFKWVELRAPTEMPEGWRKGAGRDVIAPWGESMFPSDKRFPGKTALEDALKYEGETMGHCVGGYCPDVAEGRSKIYSLRDKKGQPHVTIEVKPGKDKTGLITADELPPEELADMKQRNVYDPNFMYRFNDQMGRYLPELGPFEPSIVQIKGKGNKAPKDEYLPAVQDFVRSGNFAEVGDLQNTGLYKVNKDFLGELSAFKPSRSDLEHLSRSDREEALMQAIEAGSLPKSGYVTRDEWEEALKLHGREPTPGPTMEFLREMGGLPPEEFSDGGAVHMASGGLAKLAKLVRAPAKSKAEIEALAERLAPQVTGEYVRKDAKTAKTVADKTQKQFQREKMLSVDVRPTSAERIADLMDIERIKGNVMIGIPGDPTLTGKTLYSVGDVKLGSPSPQHGGPQYGLYNDEDKFWASGIGAARRVQNLAKEAGEQYDANVAGNYIMMGPESINYAQHFADANLQAIDLSKMTKKQVEQFNKLIRFGSPESGPRPFFPGIQDKEEAYLQMAMDPALRKHFNALMQQPTVTETLNLPSGTDIRFAITEPSLRDLETGVTGFSMGRMRPEISAKDLELSLHPTYSHDIPGEFLGQSKYPMPYELSFPDTLKMIREDPKQAPHEFGSLKMVGPRQIIDQQMIDEIKSYEERMKALTGKKAGGIVRGYAAGGMVSDANFPTDDFDPDRIDSIVAELHAMNVG